MSEQRFTLPYRSAQGLIGLALAALIAGGWLGIHAYAMFVFELSWSNLPFAILMAAVQCWLSVGVFIVCHDAMHGSLLPGKGRVNAAIATVLLFLYAGFAWRTLRDAHHTHHRLAGHKGDPDFDEDNPSSFARWYWTFFKRYFGWQSLIFVHTVVGIYWLVLGIPMVQIVLLYGAPALLSSLQLFYFGTYRPHHHADAKPFADKHNARTDGFSTLTSLLTCFHFGYHLEHHHRPDVPWWALPAARRARVVEQSYEAGTVRKEIAA
ncbi:Fatty acid desaturase [Erythrobacter sp. NAP1]|uniref:fatty acid desaturase n=1 Tax=Erythrobacter sp. NAP1 TaxID=237727 RepID=UPI00006851D6|nr:fatty acid desaturase [Erythrobacter sp. NAP1]EAQ27736.1 Fatty acid desaturase [Erythrobacter sp. NAP1]